VVRFDGELTSLAALLEAVEDCGFDASDATTTTATGETESNAVASTATTTRPSATTQAAAAGGAREAGTHGVPASPPCTAGTAGTAGSAPGQAPAASRSVTLAVGGMSCQHCADWVKQALDKVDGRRYPRPLFSST
jgi:hypothetical protein